MYKLDLHSHSQESPDGGLSLKNYQQAVSSKLVDYVAITDHNSIDFATQAQKILGDCIIVGEEIMTNKGEIIGLYLKDRVSPGLSPLETIKRIKEQDGLVYIPHPFETMRHGLHPATLEEIADYIDIVEVYNGRASVQNRSAQTVVWAKLNRMTTAASSDAHGYKGLGRTYTTINGQPRRENILQLLSEGTNIAGRPPFQAFLYPKYHRIRKKLGVKS